MYIILIGLLVIFIKKRISRQIIQRIPKSNILPQHRLDLEPPSESFQMVTLHSTPRIFEVGHINETDTGILQLPCQFSRLRLKSISQIFYFSFNKDVFLC